MYVCIYIYVYDAYIRASEYHAFTRTIYVYTGIHQMFSHKHTIYALSLSLSLSLSFSQSIFNQTNTTCMFAATRAHTHTYAHTQSM